MGWVSYQTNNLSVRYPEIVNLGENHIPASLPSKSSATHHSSAPANTEVVIRSKDIEHLKHATHIKYIMHVHMGHNTFPP